MKFFLKSVILLSLVFFFSACGKKEIEPRFAFVSNKDVVSGDSLVVTHNIQEANSDFAKKYIVIRDKEMLIKEGSQKTETRASIEEIKVDKQANKDEELLVFTPPKIKKEEIRQVQEAKEIAKIKALEQSISELKNSNAVSESEVKKVSSMIENRITCIQKKCIIGVEDSDKRAWFAVGTLGILNINPKKISFFSEFMKSDVFNELKNQYDRISDNLGEGFKITTTSMSNVGNKITLNGEITDKAGKKSSIEIKGEVALIKGIYGYIQDVQISKINNINIKNR